MTMLEYALLFVASFVGGAMNSIAGGGTLATFPALVWLGVDAKVANATSTVALLPGSGSAFYGFRGELAGSREYIIRLGLISLFGGGFGASLLLLTPSETFERLVPFLILFATLLFMLRNTISRRLKLSANKEDGAIDKPRASWWAGALLFQFASATYGGYFGAGNGIVMLATLGLLGIHDIHKANGIKNFLAVCINLIAVIGFALGEIVRWESAVLMAFGAIAGGYYGAALARKLGRRFVNFVVISIGMIIGLVMLWQLYR